MSSSSATKADLPLQHRCRGKHQGRGHRGFLSVGDVGQPNTVRGDVQLLKNSFSLTRLQRNTVGGDVQLFENVLGSSDISFNTIRENLQCKENAPPPTGGGNTAAKKEDQCAAL